MMENSPIPEPEKQNQNVSPRKQKIVTSSLVTVVVAAFIFSIFQITGSIDSPFKVKGTTKAVESAFSIDASQNEELAKLADKDTDNDGLNDFDELYLYKTSPYVRDSDSDGINDDEETKNGTDPNCPEDQNCSVSSVTPLEQATLPAQGELSSEDLRTNLKQMGAPANLIDTMDDETLKQVYQDTLSETGITSEQLAGESPSNLEDLEPSPANEEITLQALQSVTADQLRELLKQAGVDEATLSQVDDAALEAVYQQSLGEQLQLEGVEGF